MKLIVAFLLGLFTITSAADTADDKGEQFSWDSSDNDKTGETQSYQGIVIQVYQDDGESPTITLGTDKDNHQNVYCLNFKGTFESDDYDTTKSVDATYTKIDDSDVELAATNCTTNQLSTTQFTITCNDIHQGTLILTFTFTKDHQGDYGLEYVVSLDGYSFSGGSDAKFVMRQSLMECSAEYPYSADSQENDEDNKNMGNNTSTESPEVDNDDDDTSTVPPQQNGVRRLLMDDADNDATDDATNDGDDNNDMDDENEETESNSIDEEDGISSDDSNEFDAGLARFVSSGQAFDKCQGSDDKKIGSKLVYQSDDDELQIVFDHFDCDMSLDPFVGLDDSKILRLNDGVGSIQVIIGIIMGAMVMLLL